MRVIRSTPQVGGHRVRSDDQVEGPKKDIEEDSDQKVETQGQMKKGQKGGRIEGLIETPGVRDTGELSRERKQRGS